MAEEYRISGDTLTGIADAIRAKKNTTAIFTPAQMAVEIESIVSGDDLPSAESAYFGTPSATGEYGIMSIGAVTKNAGNSNHNGFRFVANETVGLLGFRAYCIGGISYTLQLWDASGKNLISKSVTPSVDGWVEVRLPEPFNLFAGETYTVSSAYTGNYSTEVADMVFNPKITYKGLYHAANYQAATFPNVADTKLSSLYGIVDIIIGTAAGESTPNEYKIQTETMDGIAEEVQRITGATDKISPSQIITELSEVEVLEDYEEVAF